jgi:3-phenylpropionate/trans-cinnamate dioxygenase ferredoxin subunit
MSTAHRICGSEDLTAGEAQRIVVGGIPICLVRTREGYRAIGDTCSHEDYSLAEGEVDLDACEIECWKHGSMFSLIDGAPTTFPATRPVAVYEITISGDDVIVELP